MPKTHKHRILPGHMGGTYTPDNVEVLTVSAHAEAHRLLWENFGCEEDRIAWMGLSGLTSISDISRETQRLGSLKGGAAQKRPDVRAKHSALRTGCKHSDKTRAKIGAANKGRLRSAEIRAKISAAMKDKGRKCTEETRAKLRAINMGRKASLEARINMSNAQKIACNLPEARNRNSATHKGHAVSTRTREKISATQKQRGKVLLPTNHSACIVR